MFRKVSFLFLFLAFSSQLSEAQEVIQIIMQQECVNGMNKIRILPLTPTTNVSDYQYEFIPVTNADIKNYITPIYVLNATGNEIAIPDAPQGTFAMYKIRVTKAGYTDFVLNWYSTQCNHDGLNTFCDENNRTLLTDKLYYRAGESFTATMNGCPGFPVSVVSLGLGNKDNEGFIASHLRLSGNNVTGKVGDMPFGISVFCLTGGGCHGYTARFFVPVGTPPPPPPANDDGQNEGVVGVGNIIRTNDPLRLRYKKGDAIAVEYKTNFGFTSLRDLEDCRVIDRANIGLELSDKFGGWGTPTVLAQEVVQNPNATEAGTFFIYGTMKDVEEGSGYKLRVKFNYLEREVVSALNANCKSTIGTKQELRLPLDDFHFYENTTPISIIKPKCSELERLDFSLTDATQEVEVKAIQIQSKNVIKNGSSLVLKADVVDLIDGFDSESPAFFEATPSGCIED